MNRGQRGAGRPATVSAVGVVLLLLVGVVALLLGPDRTPTAGSSPDTGARITATPDATSAPSAQSPTPAVEIDPESGLRLVSLASLPAEARHTVRLIDAGGPFPYAKDGSTFGNREGLLPAQRSGFYREYTVRTPGEADRGARRIVTGDRDRQLFYTADHYASFVRIRR